MDDLKLFRSHLENLEFIQSDRNNKDLYMLNDTKWVRAGDPGYYWGMALAHKFHRLQTSALLARHPRPSDASMAHLASHIR